MRIIRGINKFIDRFYMKSRKKCRINTVVFANVSHKCGIVKKLQEKLTFFCSFTVRALRLTFPFFSTYLKKGVSYFEFLARILNTDKKSEIRVILLPRVIRKQKLKGKIVNFYFVSLIS